MEEWRVTFLPALAPPESFAGTTAVVIDVLRATTTIVAALAAGAQRVIPCLEVDEALRLAEVLDPRPLLGGERGGRRIEGFDLGNSPSEYTATRVAGRTIVFTTTNGTRALQHCRLASSILVAAFANFSAVCDELLRVPTVHILCAGTDGHVTREDVLLAGALVAARLEAGGSLRLNDQAQLACEAWKQVRQSFAGGQPLAESLRQSQGARNLIEIGQERDIELAATLDRVGLLPRFDAIRGEVRVA